MKSINFSSGMPKQIKPKTNEVNILEKRIKKTLLEKYKPKVLARLRDIAKLKIQRRGFRL